MARSYPSRRFPGGPYIEPSVTPALRGPKRTGPIGELVPGDDVEVARILARLGRKPLKEPVVYAIKLSSDREADRQIEEVEEGFFTWPVEYDVNLLSLVYVSLHASVAATTGDYRVQLVKVPDEIREAEGETEVDLLYEDYRLWLPEGMRHTKNVDTSTDPDIAEQAHIINLEYAQVEWGDGIRIDFDEVPTDPGRGLTIHFYFR